MGCTYLCHDIECFDDSEHLCHLSGCHHVPPAPPRPASFSPEAMRERDWQARAMWFWITFLLVVIIFSSIIGKRQHDCDESSNNLHDATTRVEGFHADDSRFVCTDRGSRGATPAP